MSPEFDTILSTTHWQQAILCFVCRKPPARLVKEELWEMGVEDPYCRGEKDQLIYHDHLMFADTDFRHDDVFVAVKRK